MRPRSTSRAIPAAVAEDVGVNIYNSRPAFWVSDSGLLTYFSGSTYTKRPLVWVDRDGKQQSAAPDETYWNLSLAPGAERMAFRSGARHQRGFPTWTSGSRNLGAASQLA